MNYVLLLMFLESSVMPMSPSPRNIHVMEVQRFTVRDTCVVAKRKLDVVSKIGRAFCMPLDDCYEAGFCQKAVLR